MSNLVQQIEFRVRVSTRSWVKCASIKGRAAVCSYRPVVPFECRRDRQYFSLAGRPRSRFRTGHPASQAKLRSALLELAETLPGTKLMLGFKGNIGSVHLRVWGASKTVSFLDQLAPVVIRVLHDNVHVAKHIIGRSPDVVEQARPDLTGEARALSATHRIVDVNVVTDVGRMTVTVTSVASIPMISPSSVGRSTPLARY